MMVIVEGEDQFVHLSLSGTKMHSCPDNHVAEDAVVCL